MSDGMSDAAAEGRIYSAVKSAVFDLRDAALGVSTLNEMVALAYAGKLRWSRDVVAKLNEIIADTYWSFELAQYAEAVHVDLKDGQAERLWDAAFSLRRALRHLNVGHRGWSPVVDGEVDGLLQGSGYLLIKTRSGGFTVLNEGDYA